MRGFCRRPVDLPLFTAADLSSVFAAVAAGNQVVLVPSRDGSGTNALYRSPPTLFPSRFGPGSRELHVHEAHPLARLGVPEEDLADAIRLVAARLLAQSDREPREAQAT